MGPFVRCLCLGQEDVLPMKYDPRERKYHVDHAHLSPALGAAHRRRFAQAGARAGLRHELARVGGRDGVPYAIDFMNPAPDMDVNSLTPQYFEWAVERMADLVIRLATEPRPQARELKWDGSLAAGRMPNAAARPEDARAAQSDAHARTVLTSYRRNAVSAVRMGRSSSWACATSIRSNGSR